MINGVLNGRKGDTFQFRGVQSVAQHSEARINAFVGDDAFFPRDDVDDFVAHTFAVFKQRFGPKPAQNRVFTLGPPHGEFTLPFVGQHFENLLHHSGFSTPR